MDRVALMVRHESVLARLEEALKDNNSLQHIMMDQAGQVHMQGFMMSRLPATACSQGRPLSTQGDASCES